MQAPPYVEILIKYDGESITGKERQNLFKPLIDINNLGTELNIPISHKIIEGHNGTIDIRSEGNINVFIIRLPVADLRSTSVMSDVKLHD